MFWGKKNKKYQKFLRRFTPISQENTLVFNENVFIFHFKIEFNHFLTQIFPGFDNVSCYSVAVPGGLYIWIKFKHPRGALYLGRLDLWGVTTLRSQLLDEMAHIVMENFNHDIPLIMLHKFFSNTSFGLNPQSLIWFNDKF